MGVCSLLFLLVGVQAAPFTNATVTRVENQVSLGERRAAQSAIRRAAVADVVRENQFLLSEANSRAELQYPDGSLVRIGQNTVFSFDSESRTLSLEKGALLFHIPKGSGGGTIKTPSLTAAITGTAGKVSTNIIAIVEGEVKLVPSGRIIHAGEFARRNADGSITIRPFDPDSANDGLLVNWNGLMPGFGIDKLVAHSLELPDMRFIEVLQRTQNLPGTLEHFFPEPNQVDRPKTRVTVPPRRNVQPDRDSGNY